MTHHIDVAIIGAGAAGIAAGRRLAATTFSFLLIEASDRTGGRAWTRTVEGMKLDLGCGWLHSADRNPWTALARDEGVTIDETPPAWGRQFADLGFSREDRSAAQIAFEAFDRRLREQPPASDRASDALDPNERWNAFFDARSGYVNGTGLANLSVADYRAYDEADTGVNWRLPDGYGSLIAAAADTLPVQLGTHVTEIDRRSDPLLLVTSRGTVEARAVIVTAPTSVLASEALRFVPSLDDKIHAAASLPLGLADKLFFGVDDAEELDPDSHMLGNPHRSETGSYYLRPFGRPIIEVFLGGSTAWLLESEGPRGAIAFAVDELANLFGSTMRRRLDPLAASTWGRTEWIRGSYSHALPGEAGARAALARPIENRIFFAGEACSPSDFSTAHGAYQTGWDAAESAIEALAPSRPI